LRGFGRPENFLSLLRHDAVWKFIENEKSILLEACWKDGCVSIMCTCDESSNAMDKEYIWGEVGERVFFWEKGLELKLDANFGKEKHNLVKLLARPVGLRSDMWLKVDTPELAVYFDKYMARRFGNW